MTEEIWFLNPVLLLGVGMAIVTAQLLIGVVMLALPTPGMYREPKLTQWGRVIRTGSVVKRWGRTLVEDSYVNFLVLSIFSGPKLIMSFAGELWAGSADAAYNSLFAWLGIGCQGGICGVPTGFGLLHNLLSGYRYVFWSIVGWLLTVVAITIAIIIVKGILPLWNPISGLVKIIVEFAGSIIQNIMNNYVLFMLLTLVPILIFIPLSVYLIYGLYFMARLIQQLWAPLLILGGFLYGLPARVGRKWGSVLISSMLVLYIGLPFMPVFVNSLTSTQAAEANLQQIASDYDKLLYYVLQAGIRSDVIFKVSPRPAELASPDYARIQVGGGGTQDRYIWTDASGVREYFLPPGGYEVRSIRWHGVPVTFASNGTSPFTITEDDIKAGRAGMKTVTLAADVYSYELSTGANSSRTVFFPVGYAAWSNARVFNLQATNSSVSFSFYVEPGWFGLANYEIFMFVQDGIIHYSEWIDGAPAGSWKGEVPLCREWEQCDGKFWRYAGAGAGYHTFKVQADFIAGGPPPVPKMEDDDPYSLSNLQNPLLPKPNEAQTRDLGWYYASVLVLPQVYVYIILVGLAAGLARVLKGAELI